MRPADFLRDGWCLDDAVVRHNESPTTFEIPLETIRRGLRPGDLAKLIFKIAVEGHGDEDGVERMWVVVSERMPDGSYMGLLDNEPSNIARNDDFWLGSEVPFESRHVIDALIGDAETRAWAARKPLSLWPRD